MTNLVGRTLYRLGERLPGRVSRPGEDRYAPATFAIQPLIGITTARVSV